MGHRYETAFKELRSVLQHFAHIGLRPFLCKGTLLGYARMCDLEPNDDDLSLCTFADDYNMKGRDEKIAVLAELAKPFADAGWHYYRDTLSHSLCHTEESFGGVAF